MADVVRMVRHREHPRLEKVGYRMVPGRQLDSKL